MTHTNPDGTLKTVQNQIDDSRSLGTLIGEQFKMFYFAKNLTDPTQNFYPYPQSEVVLEAVTFEQLKYPTNDLTESWPDYQAF